MRKMTFVHGVTASLALIAAATLSAPAYALGIVLKNASGTALPIGTPVTAAGPLDITIFGFHRKICNVSIDSTITAADTITFTNVAPGFLSDCPQFDPDFTMKFISFSNVQVSNISANPCNIGAVIFSWANIGSKAIISPSNVLGGGCVLNTGSYLQLTPAVKT